MKKLVIIGLILAICLALCACGETSPENVAQNTNDPSTSTQTEPVERPSSKIEYPKIDEIEYYFVNGVYYGEPSALMGYTNNSEYTIVEILFDFAIKADATEEELSAFDALVEKGSLEKEELNTLKPHVVNHMVTDPGETVEGATCTLVGWAVEATDAKQCELFVLEGATISFLSNDGLIYKVAYSAENNGYTVKNGTEDAKSWTTGNFAKAIPIPDTRFITVGYDESDYYEFTAYDMTYDQYRAYCKACQSAGFTNEIEDNDTSFWCTNDAGLTINIKYYAYLNAMGLRTK